MASFGTAGRGFDAIAGEDAFGKVTFRSPCTLLTDDVEIVVKEPVFVLAFAITTLFDGDVLVSGYPGGGPDGSFGTFAWPGGGPDGSLGKFGNSTQDGGCSGSLGLLRSLVSSFSPSSELTSSH